MEIWKKFIDNSNILNKIMEEYLEMRLLLKKLGHTESSIAKISSGPQELFDIGYRLASHIKNLQNQLKDYGMEVSNDDYKLYLKTKFDKIDLLIPLNDGNNKGNNSRDEDY